MGYAVLRVLPRQRLALPAVMVLLLALAVLLANLVTDLAYAWLDPRIRYD